MEDDRILIVRDKADSGFYELLVNGVHKSDAGTYSCTAANLYGKCSCEATIKVIEDKQVFPELPSALLEAGDEAHFKWFRDGQPFDPEERFNVLFKVKKKKQ